MDVVSYLFLAVGFGTLAVVLSMGRYYWWLEAPWLGWLLVVSIVSLVIVAVIELNRKYPLLDIKWLLSPEVAHFAGVLMLFRMLMTEQSSGISGFFQQAGLLKEIPMVVHPASLDHVIVQAVGDAAQGVQVTSHWNDDFDNPVNKAFVAAWKAKYGDRPITYYAAQGYDAALLVGVGLEKSPSGLEDLAAFRKALLTSEIPTVRGKFKFGANQHPVQDWYALTAEKGADGKMVLKTEKKVLTDHGDVYASECKMAKD